MYIECSFVVYIQLQNSMEDVQQYEVGSEFLNFIQKQPTAAVELEDYHFEEMDPEE